jgi:putative RNA 2'-phosphotransferase
MASQKKTSRMINENENTTISKFLSLVLRHKPETIGISLDDQGWTDVGILLRKFNEQGHPITTEILEHVVKTNIKKRFAFNADHTKIRANQGHSVEVELGYEAKQPPKVLYHGTAVRFLESIMKTGLLKQTRHHVHLSEDIDTAIHVGQRYGKPVLLEISAGEMEKSGFTFYVSDNNVWLTDHVPIKYISVTK